MWETCPWSSDFLKGSDLNTTISLRKLKFFGTRLNHSVEAQSKQRRAILEGPQKSHHCSGGRRSRLCVLASDICQLRTAGSVLRTLQILGLLLELRYDWPWWASSVLPSPGSLWSPNLQTCLSSISLWTLWHPALAPCLSPGPGPTYVATNSSIHYFTGPKSSSGEDGIESAPPLPSVLLHNSISFFSTPTPITNLFSFSLLLTRPSLPSSSSTLWPFKFSHAPFPNQ